MCVCVPGSRFGSPPLPPQWYGTPLPPRKFPTRMLFAAFQVAASHSLAAQRRDAIAFSKATRGSRALGCPRLEPEGHRQDWHPHVTWAVGIKLHTCYLQHLRDVYFLQNTSVLLMYYLQAVYILPIYIYVFRPIAYLYTTHM